MHARRGRRRAIPNLHPNHDLARRHDMTTTIEALPPPGQRSAPATYVALMDAWHSAIAAYSEQASAAATEINGANAASAALVAAATARVNAAAIAAGAVAGVSGAPYAPGGGGAAGRERGGQV